MHSVCDDTIYNINWASRGYKSAKTVFFVTSLMTRNVYLLKVVLSQKIKKIHMLNHGYKADMAIVNDFSSKLS